MACEGQIAQQDHGHAGVLIGGQAKFGATVDAQAVEKLKVVRVKPARHLSHACSVRLITACRGMQTHGRALQHPRHVLQGHAGTQSSRTQVHDELNQASPIMGRQRIEQFKHMGAIDAAQHLTHHRALQLARPERNRLVGQ